MTNADLHQIAWKIAAENPIPATDDLAASIATALTEARTAGFNEAKERAVAECRAYEKRMTEAAARRAASDKPHDVALSKADAGNSLAEQITALQAMKQGGNDG